MKLAYDKERDQQTLIDNRRNEIIEFLESQIQEIKDNPEIDYNKAVCVLSHNNNDHSGYDFYYSGLNTTIFDVLYIFEKIKHQYLTNDITSE